MRRQGKGGSILKASGIGIGRTGHDSIRLIKHRLAARAGRQNRFFVATVFAEPIFEFGQRARRGVIRRFYEALDDWSGFRAPLLPWSHRAYLPMQ